MLGWVFLSPLRRYSELGLLAFRLFLGALLLWSIWSKITQPDGAGPLVTFLARNNLPLPAVLAQLSIWTQFTVALAFIMGLFTRWAGVLCVVNFSVALALTHRTGGMAACCAPACLLMSGLYLALYGSGAFGLDRMFEAPASPPSAFRAA